MSVEPASPAVTDRDRWLGFFDAVEQAVVTMGPGHTVPMIVPPQDAGPIPADLAERARDVLRLIDEAQRLVEATIDETWRHAPRADRSPRNTAPAAGAFDILA